MRARKSVPRSAGSLGKMGISVLEMGIHRVFPRHTQAPSAKLDLPQMICAAWPCMCGMKAGSFTRCAKNTESHSQRSAAHCSRKGLSPQQTAPTLNPSSKDSGRKKEPSLFRSERKRQSDSLQIRLTLPRLCASDVLGQNCLFADRFLCAHWLELDKFLPSLLTEHCDVTTGPPSAP